MEYTSVPFFPMRIKTLCVNSDMATLLDAFDNDDEGAGNLYHVRHMRM